MTERKVYKSKAEFGPFGECMFEVTGFFTPEVKNKDDDLYVDEEAKFTPDGGRFYYDGWITLPVEVCLNLDIEDDACEQFQQEQNRLDAERESEGGYDW